MAPAHARLAFLLSGSGSTLANLLARIDDGSVPAEVVFVLSDRESATGLEHARQRGIPVAVVSRRAVKGLDAYSKAFEEALRPYAPDLVVNGGFLTIYRVPPDLRGRILNVHPSLLPAVGGKGCYGSRVHRAVLERGCLFTGCTVHYVTDEVDGGPIVAQQVVPVRADDTADTLAARVQEAERALYPRAIADVIEGRVQLVDGRIVRKD
jgi:phosphoribosylglycinamide formyltransferase-1